MSFSGPSNDPGLPADFPSIILPPPSGDVTGARDDLALANAIAQGIGVIQGRRGRYFLATPPVLSSLQFLGGVGGRSAGALPGTTFQFMGSGAGNFITVGATESGVMDAMILAGVAGFTGRVIAAANSTFPRVDRCYVGATDTTAAILIDCDNSIDGRIRDNNIVGGKYGISQIATLGHFTNGYNILGNRIGGQGAAGGCILGLGSGALVGGNIFELQPGQAALRAGPSPSLGSALVGNWTGDAAAATIVMELFANGLLIGGNYIGGNAGTALKFMGASDGIAIKGNRLDSHTLGIDKNAQVVVAEIGPNSYVNVTTHHNFVAAGAPFVEA